MKFRVNQPADGHTMFGDDPFKGSLGNVIKLNLPDGSSVDARVIATGGGGKMAHYTLEVVDEEQGARVRQFVNAGGYVPSVVLEE